MIFISVMQGDESCFFVSLRYICTKNDSPLGHASVVVVNKTLGRFTEVKRFDVVKSAEEVDVSSRRLICGLALMTGSRNLILTTDAVRNSKRPPVLWTP